MYAGDSDAVFAKLEYKYNLPIEDRAMVLLQSKKNNIQGFINVGWYQKNIFPEYNFSLSILQYHAILT